MFGGLKYLDIILKPPKKGKNWQEGDREAAGAKGLLPEAGSLCLHSCVIKTTDNVPNDLGAALGGLSKEPLPGSHPV